MGQFSTAPILSQPSNSPIAVTMFGLAMFVETASPAIIQHAIQAVVAVSADNFGTSHGMKWE